MSTNDWQPCQRPLRPVDHDPLVSHQDTVTCKALKFYLNDFIRLMTKLYLGA